MPRVSLRRAGLLLFPAALALSCSSSSSSSSPAPAIPTGGETKTLSTLPGRWEGTYTNPVNGRKGTIVLEFSSGGKEAHGDILMIPPDSKVKAPSLEETLRTMPQVLQINFIEAEGSQLSGTVGPYEEPESHCRANTTFQGLHRGDSINGTFRTECVDEQGKPDPSWPSSSGTWTVSRVAKK